MQTVSLTPARSVRLYAALGLLVVMMAAGRFALARQVVEAQVTIQGLLADVAMAVLLGLLAKALRGLHWSVAVLWVAGAVVLQVVSLEMAAAVNTYFDLRDLRFALDGNFLKGSGTRLTFPWYTVALSASALLYMGVLVRDGGGVQLRVWRAAAVIAATVATLVVLSAGRADWERSNLMWLSLTRSFKGTPRAPVAPLAALQPPAEEGRPLLRATPGTKRNVLLVVLEGIPGVYLRQVQEHTGVSYPIRMPSLSRIAEESLITPNFVTHNRQTIRGLYSMLSGDYCKLSLTTPKSYEYISLPLDERKPCLPAVLAARGYATVYLQAAELGYMSKDAFMKAAGFERVLGREFFRYQHVPFGWGPDDKAFFEQAAVFLEELDRGPRPWFVTLLTVGTHHPGAVPEEFAAQYSSRRAAAAAYLDQAVGEFFERLRRKGLLEDTLLLITSDESHGVSDQPYGRFWGLAVARAPESSGGVNPGVFGLIDVPRSILDYLGLQRQALGFPGRSFFREYRSERPILFESYFSERKGIVSHRLDDGRVEVLQAGGGELFSESYSGEVVNGPRGRELARTLESYQAAADASLNGRGRREFLLLEDNLFAFAPAESKVLSTGQYLDIPAGTSVRVELEAAVEESTVEQKEEEGDGVKVILRMMEEGVVMPLPRLSIPVLKEGNKLRLSFSFYAAERLPRLWASLEARSESQARPLQLRVERFAVRKRERQARHDFRVERLQVR